LWEEFYPRIRHENSPAGAAVIVACHLAERLTVVALPGEPHEVLDIWRRQITDQAGLAIINVAALRSVGVPARLAGEGAAEFWNGAKWQAAPALAGAEP
jgi:cobalamin biosynthesis protein CobT